MADLPTKEDFIEYERLRKAGKHNMWHYAALDPDIHEVIKHYDELCELYPEVRA
jgi:hypothetical protein